jgi:uncharacterized membrane protein YdjX (TVP38/TMEM64 family)
MTETVVRRPLPEPGPGDIAPEGGRPVLRLLRPLLFLVGLLLAGLLLHRFHAGLPGREVLQDGLQGRLLFLLVGSLACAVGLPRQLVCFAAGLAYAALPGVLLSTVATVCGCLLAFGWARLVARDWVRRRFGRRLARLERIVRGRPFAAVLFIRLLPVGSSLLLNLGAGLVDVPVLPFLGATLLGSLPQTLVFTLLGSGTRLGHGVQLGVALGTFAASAVVGLALLRRQPAGTS